VEIISIKGTVEVLTGLHIGGSDDIMKIGGIDNPVIKTANGKPYIPGSSIKGKMRSLLEWKYGLVLTNGGKGKPFGSDRLNSLDNKMREKAEILIKLIGDSCANASADDKVKFGITRISVSDCYLSGGQDNIELTEAKYENVIDRRSGTASSPRQSERVPAGIKFNFDIRVKILEGDDKNELINMVKEGLNLIEQDYLGGSGSRGYGRVKFSIIENNNAAAENND
jgi:CRISPR-associated protein Csm3